MRRLRYRAVFPRDAFSPTVQRDLSKFTRIGMISAVDALKGTCTIKWLDHPGSRYNVILTQASPKEWIMPEVKSVVLVAFDQYERARIVRYINVGQATRIQQTQSLPQLNAGERLWEVGGSYLHMKINGDIVLATATEGYFTIENRTGTLKSETVNWKCTTNGGIGFFGAVQRFMLDTQGNTQSQYVVDMFGNVYTEYNLKVVEFGDGALGVSGISDPLVDITLGTKVDAVGNIIMKNDKPASPTSSNKQLCVDIKLKSGVRITIDKEGRTSITGLKLNLNNGSVDNGDPDIILGLETNDAALGTRGQHVAREHDKVIIPLSASYTEKPVGMHSGLTSIASLNLATLTKIAASFISPAGPCTLNPALLTDPTELKGEITEGAPDIYVGGKE